MPGYLIAERETITKTVSGILLPTEQKTDQAVVITTDGACALKPNDRILMKKYAGHEMEVEGRKFLVVKLDEIIAVMGASEPA